MKACSEARVRPVPLACGWDPWNQASGDGGGGSQASWPKLWAHGGRWPCRACPEAARRQSAFAYTDLLSPPPCGHPSQLTAGPTSQGQVPEKLLPGQPLLHLHQLPGETPAAWRGLCSRKES